MHLIRHGSQVLHHRLDNLSLILVDVLVWRALEHLAAHALVLLGGQLALLRLKGLEVAHHLVHLLLHI